MAGSPTCRRSYIWRNSEELRASRRALSTTGELDIVRLFGRQPRGLIEFAIPQMGAGPAFLVSLLNGVAHMARIAPMLNIQRIFLERSLAPPSFLEHTIAAPRTPPAVGRRIVYKPPAPFRTSD